MFIDFDTGKLFSPVEAQLKQHVQDWEKRLAETGIDAACDTARRRGVLIGINMFVYPVAADDGDDFLRGFMLPVGEKAGDTGLHDLVGGLRGGFPIPISAEGKLPRTYLIRTRENGIGVLQILEVTGLPQAGVKIRYRMAVANAGLTLHQAAAAGDGMRVRDLLKEGEDVNARDAEGRTPLHLAAGTGRCDLMRYVLAQKANVKLTDNEGRTALHAAAENAAAWARVKDVLLKAGADPTAKDAHGHTAAELAEQMSALRKKREIEMNALRKKRQIEATADEPETRDEGAEALPDVD